jgi:hypothetical protein
MLEGISIAAGVILAGAIPLVSILTINNTGLLYFMPMIHGH